MSESLGTTTSLTAQSVQQRYEFYFVSLTFTLLAAAVQTADPSTMWTSIIETISWLLLLLAGLWGLRRLEWLGFIYNLHSHQYEWEERTQGLKKLKVQGERAVHALDVLKDVPIDTAITNAARSVDLVKERLDVVEKGERKYYRFRKWAFLIGLGALVAARCAQMFLELLRRHPL